MDAAVASAVAAVHLDDGVQQPWFELICQTYDELAGDLDWDRFAESLATRAEVDGVDRQLVEQFTRYLADYDSMPLHTVGQLRELADQLPGLYRDLTAAQPADAPYDEERWNAYLAEFGRSWDGTDTSWDEFRAWFLYHAEQSTLGEPAAAFITYTESQSDKRAVFAEYGVPIPEPATETYDPAHWNGFLAEFGSWWDGVESTWDQFRTWFLYHAQQTRLGEPATAFLDYAEGQSDKPAVFATYGVPIAAPAPTTAVAPTTDTGQRPQHRADASLLGTPGEPQQPTAAPATAAPPIQQKSTSLPLLRAVVDFAVFKLEQVLPARFLEFGHARRGFVAGMTGLPLDPPTDPQDLEEWERGMNTAATLLIVEAIVGAIPPGAGGGGPGRVMAPAGGGAVHVEPMPQAAVPRPPVMPPKNEARAKEPTTSTTPSTAAPAAGATRPTPPPTEAERRAQAAKNPSNKVTKPSGETPKQAAERSAAEQKKFEESGGKPKKITGPVEDHHVVSNKTENSESLRESQEILRNARTSADQKELLNSDRNIVPVENHGEAHGENYHVLVRNRLKSAVGNLEPHTPEYREAVLKELGNLKRDCGTKGTQINLFVIRRSAGGVR